MRCITTITPHRLMEESESRIETAARSGTAVQALVARRMLEDIHIYRRWEAEHFHLLKDVTREQGRLGQLISLRAAACAFIHRKALFEYLRDQKVTGARRHFVVSLMHGGSDYASSVVAEHGNYLRSASSLLCASHLGVRVLADGVFDEPLYEYEELYTEYFRTFCDAALAGARDARESGLLALLPDLKRQLSERRRSILRMPEMPVYLDYEKLRQPTGDTVRLGAL